MITLRKLLSEKGYTAIALKATTTNHFEIKAKINGSQGRFILDTGASNTCLGLESVSYFGLQTEFSQIKAAGAGSSEIETNISKGNLIEIGAWKTKRLTIIVMDLSHVNLALDRVNTAPVQGIIGGDILKRGKAIIDYPNKKLYLKNSLIQ